MAMSRAHKESHIEAVRSTFDESNTLYLVDLAGLSVNEVNKLRAAIRETGGNMRVIRNRLAKRIMEEEPRASLREYMVGPTAVVHHPSEPVSAAKALATFAKDHPALGIKAGLVEGRQVVDESGVKSIAKLPGLEETRAMLLAMISTPATQLVRLLATPATQVARVLEARGEAEG